MGLITNEIYLSIRQELQIELRMIERQRAVTSDDEACISIDGFLGGLDRAVDIIDRLFMEQQECQTE